VSVRQLLYLAPIAAVLLASSSVVNGQDGVAEELVVLTDLAGLGRDENSVTYFKASNAGAYERFGESIALSADGTTLAVGAIFEDSSATGVGGDQADFSAPNAGAVYIFTRTGSNWSQQAYIKASNTGASDRFGLSVALSHDGDTLAVGALGEDSAATGINGDQHDNSIDNAGAAYIFTRENRTWSQQAYIKASNTGRIEEGDQFGYDVVLNGNGDTLAVSAISEDSAATGVGGEQDDDSAAEIGAVYVYSRDGADWSQQAYLKPRSFSAEMLIGGILFGFAIGMDESGNTLAISGFNEETNRGSIYVFERAGSDWFEQARLVASNPEIGDGLGSAIAVSADGNTIAAGAFDEDSALVGIVPSDQGIDDQRTDDAIGAAYVFVRRGDTWSQQAFIKPTNTQVNQHFGWTLALSLDGDTLAVGAHFENGGSTGINGDQRDTSAQDAGAAYVYSRSGTTWTPRAYVKASNTFVRAEFGSSLALNDDGTVLAVGAPREADGAAGINGNQAADSAAESGAVYIY